MGRDRAEENPQFACDLDVVDPRRTYLAMTLLGTEDDEVELGFITNWAGWADEHRRIELRKPRPVHGDKVADMWRHAGETFIVVNGMDGLAVYLRAGGNALIDVNVASETIADMLQPEPSVRGGMVGYTSISSLPPRSLQHAPTPKQRMQILKRDNRRCRICGRSPETNTDLELHVHHIRPWGIGGVTVPENLITLCHTCHGGLEPHDDWSLFSLIPKPTIMDCSPSEAYNLGVSRYRSLMAVTIAENPGSPRPRGLRASQK